MRHSVTLKFLFLLFTWPIFQKLPQVWPSPPNVIQRLPYRRLRLQDSCRSDVHPTDRDKALTEPNQPITN